MTIVYVCIVFTAIFAAGYYLLAHFNEFMRKTYKDSYGDGEGNGIIVVSKKKKNSYRSVYL